MAFSGRDFYNRLSEVCSKNGTNITAFLKGIGKSQSAGTYMRKKESPDGKIAAIAAEQFNVSTEWLLGLTDEPSPLAKKDFFLSDDDRKLIEALRSASKPVRNMVINLALTALKDASEIFDGASRSNPYFLTPKGIQVSPKCAPVPVPKSPPGVYKPVLGKAAAGLPITTVPEDGERRVMVPVKFTGEQYFIVQAQGDSMEPGIRSGAYCVFDKYGDLAEGRVVLVQVDGATDQPDATIKRAFLRPGGRVMLKSDNPKYRPMLYPVDEVQVMGALVAVLPGSVDAAPSEG